MPSSYTLSLRLTLQATGENNNTWGVILNQGVFGLVDYAIAGRLAFTLSGSKTLTTALGAADESRAAFLAVTGGAGGQIVLPAASKGYFVANAASGDVVLSAGSAFTATFATGDVGPVFSDGSGVYPILLGNKTLRRFISDADQAILDYVNAAISAGNQLLPPAAGQEGKALMVRDVGVPPAAAWVPDFVQQADVAGLVAALATLTAADAAVAANAVLSRAFYGDMF